MTRPAGWTEALYRLADLLGYREAEWWVREAVSVRWGVAGLQDLAPRDQALAFQKTSGLVAAVEDAWSHDRRFVLYEDGTLANVPGRLRDGRRARVRELVERNFAVRVEGPPWRLGEEETDRPSREEWESADF